MFIYNYALRLIIAFKYPTNVPNVNPMLVNTAELSDATGIGVVGFLALVLCQAKRDALASLAASRHCPKEVIAFRVLVLWLVFTHLTVLEKFRCGPN